MGESALFVQYSNMPYFDKVGMAAHLMRNEERDVLIFFM
ncbi:hypothetical protein HNQ56_002946 [Anaerotaenia torta]